jgi:hypothetical protein
LAAEDEASHDHVVGLHAERRGFELPEAVQQQAGAGQQNHGEGDFKRDQSGSPTANAQRCRTA